MQTADRIKGHLEPSYNQARRVLGNVDNEIQTLKAIHSFIAPVLDLHSQGRVFNDKLNRASNSYDNIRNHVAAADKMGRSAASVVATLSKHGVGIGL